MRGIRTGRKMSDEDEDFVTLVEYFGHSGESLRDGVKRSSSDFKATCRVSKRCRAGGLKLCLGDSAEHSRKNRKHCREVEVVQFRRCGLRQIRFHVLVFKQ